MGGSTASCSQKRPVSPQPRPGQGLPQGPMASLPQQVSERTMPPTQQDGRQQYGIGPSNGYRPNSMHQWHESHPQGNSQWVQPQAPAMGQGDMACMSQNMGTSFGSMQMNPLPIHQWQQASPWNQIVPQQAIPQVPVQNDAMLNQALLAALAQRQLEEQCALAEACEKAKADAQNKARPSSKASAPPPEEAQLHAQETSAEYEWIPEEAYGDPEIVAAVESQKEIEEGSTEEDFVSPAQFDDLGDDYLAEQLHNNFKEETSCVKAEMSDVAVDQLKQESMDDESHLHQDDYGDSHASSEDEEFDLDDLMNDLDKLKKKIDRCKKKRKIM